MKTKTLLIDALASALAACGATESSSPSSQGSVSVTEASAGKSTLMETDGYDNTNSSDDTSGTSHSDAGRGHGGGTNIPYLRENHDRYSHYSDVSSYPVQMEINGDEIYWDILADSEEGAIKLAEHVEFMSGVLHRGKVPRNWDKLFVLEAYMHNGIDETVEQDGQRVTIYKTANNQCGYAVIRAHASAVSNDFFGAGDLTGDYSTVADDILAMDVCAEYREDAEAFIAEHWEPR